MMNEDPLMTDEQAGDAVAKYLEDNPELLQGIEPGQDLWPAIESRIAARVIPMSMPTVRRARRTTGWIPMLIAASALIAGTAGITYVVTTRANTARTAAAVATTGTTGTTGTAAASENTTEQLPSPDTQSSETAAATSGVNVVKRGASTPKTAQPTMQLASHANRGAGDEVRKTYDTEIASLHSALESRRSQLNPATVAIIEQNLAVIDEAIRQSETALARDPNSRLLNEQLDRTLAKKTGLLRAAVLLPAA
jgi:hypothetical protein